VPTLERGEQRSVSLTIAAPAAGDWLVKFDVKLADGRRLSDLGLTVLQIPLKVAP